MADRIVDFLSSDFFVAPFYMGFVAGIWWPLILHYGGLFLGGFLISLSEEKKHMWSNTALEPTPTAPSVSDEP